MRQWANAFVRVMDDEALGERMCEAGIKRAKLFSWEKAAREILDVFKGLK